MKIYKALQRPRLFQDFTYMVFEPKKLSDIYPRNHRNNNSNNFQDIRIENVAFK